MNERMLESLASRAVVAPRRRSLLLLGGATAAALARRSPAAAASKSKKTCNKEKQQCRRFLQQFCEGIPPAQCIDSLLPCCATCKVAAGLRCLLEAK